MTENTHDNGLNRNNETTPHGDVRILQLGMMAFTALCSCGWTSPSRGSVSSAVDQAKRHLRSAGVPLEEWSLTWD
jgi:hypothetical protein